MRPKQPAAERSPPSRSNYLRTGPVIRSYGLCRQRLISQTTAFLTPKPRYNVVVSSLAPEFATEIRDLLISPPADDPYQKLRDALIARTQKSEQARLRELLDTADIGNRQPSRVLRRMQQLLGGKSLDNSLLREMFVQRFTAHSSPDSICNSDYALD